jgi:hypothetical protein
MGMVVICESNVEPMSTDEIIAVSVLVEEGRPDMWGGRGGASGGPGPGPAYSRHHRWRGVGVNSSAVPWRGTE